MHPFYVSACDEYGGFYDALAFDSLEDAKNGLSSLYDALEECSIHREHVILAAIEELSFQITAAECPPD
jgi:hypothetical protein